MNEQFVIDVTPIPQFEGIEESTDYSLFDLRTGETLRRLDELLDIELRGIALFALQMNLKNLAALFLGRQIDKEDLVESPLSEQFRRQSLDLIGRGDHKNRRLFLL